MAAEAVQHHRQLQVRSPRIISTLEATISAHQQPPSKMILSIGCSATVGHFPGNVINPQLPRTRSLNKVLGEGEFKSLLSSVTTIGFHRGDRLNAFTKTSTRWINYIFLLLQKVEENEKVSQQFSSFLWLYIGEVLQHRRGQRFNAPDQLSCVRSCALLLWFFSQLPVLKIISNRCLDKMPPFVSQTNGKSWKYCKRYLKRRGYESLQRGETFSPFSLGGNVVPDASHLRIDTMAK